MLLGPRTKKRKIKVLPKMPILTQRSVYRASFLLGFPMMFSTVDGLPDADGCLALLRALCRKKCPKGHLSGWYFEECECHRNPDFIPAMALDLLEHL